MRSNDHSTLFTDEDIRRTQPALKIGLLATVSPQGLPHVTLLSSLMACSPTQLSFGQFTEGLSKKYLVHNPKAGFLIMSLDRYLWRGQATYTHSVKAGPEFDYYNNVPMFRYNAYFGIHTVHYLQLVSQTGRAALPMNRIVIASLLTALGRSLARTANPAGVLNPWTMGFLNKLGNLKFLAYLRPDGCPAIVPAIQAQAWGKRHVVFSTSVYRDEIDAIPAGASVAVFGMSLAMEDVLMRGRYLGARHLAGVRTGVLEVDWVYNSMPPVPGQVYPPVEVTAVTEY